MDYVVNGKNFAFTNSDIVILLLLTIWSYGWKIPAIWRTVKNENKKWFVALLILNTFGILEIAYLMYFSNKTKPKI